MPSRYIPQRIKSIDIGKSMTVIDYGCGHGRFTGFFAEKVGKSGKVYAVDILQEAINNVEKIVYSLQLTNIVPVLANGYDSGLQNDIADRVYAIDMFHSVDDTSQFLYELYRIIKKDGILYIDYGHQAKEQALGKINESNVFEIIETHSKYVVLKPKVKI